MGRHVVGSAVARLGNLGILQARRMSGVVQEAWWWGAGFDIRAGGGGVPLVKEG